MYDVSSGVPQGSHLAPLLFNIFINDIKLTNSHMLLFADDLKLFRIIKSPDDAVLLQNEINVLSNWCSKNNLLLNVSKCKVLTFSRKREKYIYDYLLYESELTRVYKNSDLGIIFDESLTFNEHYLYIQNKASSMLGFINRSCKSFNNPYALKALYYSYVRSILDYASMVWSPSRIGPIRAIESIQNRFLRFLSFKCDIQRQPHSSYLPILTILNMESLEIRRKRLDLCFIFKLLNGQVYCPCLISILSFLVPNRSTRQINTFYVPLQSTNYGKNAPMNRCMELVNTYNVDLFLCTNVELFKIYLNNLLI